MSKARISVIVLLFLLVATLPINANSTGDFKIVDGILIRYEGLGGDVVIPEGVTEIGERAFQAKWDLYSVKIPNTVITIGDSAFFSCRNLASVTIPNTVTTIGNTAFHDSGLSNINIPSSVTSIGYRAFSHCQNLVSIEVDAKNKHYSSKNNSLLNKDGDTLIQAPSGIKTQRFVVPQGIKTIEGSAFEGIAFIEVIEIPPSVEALYSASFQYTHSLKEFEVNPDNKVYKSIDGVLFTKDGKTLIKYPQQHADTSYILPYGTEVIGLMSFQFTKLLQTVTLPDTVRIVEAHAFTASNLEAIHIQEGLEEIGYAAFYNCRELGDMYIPTTVNHIESTAFVDCMGGNINVSIIGVQGSYAEDYSKESGIRFKQVSWSDNLEYTTMNLDTYANEVFSLTNIEREKAGLPKFGQTAPLTKVAGIRASELIIQFSHDRPDGQAFYTAYKEYGVGFCRAGENIAAGQKTAKEVVNGWINSPGHRANILNPQFKNLGVGMAVDEDGQRYWVQNFSD